MRRFFVADVRLHSKSLLATLSIGALAAAVTLNLLPAHALAGCAEGSECVETHDDYSTRVEGERNIDGGDSSGGSQVIDGKDVDGDVRVDADNASDHADADGGSGPSKVEMRGSSTSGDFVNGTNTQVTADSDGMVGLDQTGTEGEDLAPLAPPTGVPETATTSEPDPRADAPRDTSSIAAPARAMPSVVQDGDVKIVLRSEGSAHSGDAVSGGQVVAVVAMTGETTITATNRSVFSSARSGAAQGKVEHQSIEAGQQLVEENVEVESTDDSDDAVMHLSSPSTSAGTPSGGGGVVAQTATPLASEVNEGDTDDQPDSDSGAAQSASLLDSTSVMAVSGEQTITRSVVHDGNVVEERKTILGVKGGDAIAGGQVISVESRGGDVSVDASNQSLDADARAGDAAGSIRTGTVAAPRLSLTEESEGTGTGQPQQFGAQTATSAGNPSSTDTPSSSESRPATGSASVQQTASTTSGPAPPTDLSAPP